jgi:hypothetical protein
VLPRTTRKPPLEPYRFFKLSHSGAIETPPVCHLCASDLVALDKAQQLCGDSAVEIWLGTRYVAHIPMVQVTACSERRE